MIDLTGAAPVAEGGEHFVYQHPKRPNRLIKVLKPNSKRRRFRRPAVRRFKGLRVWHREFSEYLAALANNGRHSDRLVRLYGFRETSEGLGMVTQRITGPDGGLAPKLINQVPLHRDDREWLDAVKDDAIALFDQLQSMHVDWQDMTLSNVVVTGKKTRPRLVIIDGMGSPALIPLTHLSDWMFVKANRRQLQRFLRMIDAKAGRIPKR